MLEAGEEFELVRSAAFTLTEEEKDKGVHLDIDTYTCFYLMARLA